MGKIISSYIFPHPPIIVPEVGKGGEEDAAQTVNAVKRAASDIASEKPCTIIITTPHGPVFQDYIYISTSKRLAGDLGSFGAGSVKLEYENNINLVNGIIKHSRLEGIPAGGIEGSIIRRYRASKDLDHGVLIPLYFVDKKYKGFKIVHIAIAGLPFIDLYRFGMCISRAVRETDEKVVFLASGDLSHRLSHDGPYGYSKSGEEYDKMLVDSLEKLDVEKLLKVDESLCEKAGECGLRSFIMMFGALDGCALSSEVYSYEGPFGVGYSIARFETHGIDSKRNIFEKYNDKLMEEITETRNNESPHVRLARHALETYVNEGTIISTPDWVPEEMLENRAGVFVSIKKSGNLRGCIGTISPTKGSIAEEIIYNALSAGTRDPRFDPVERDELTGLVYSVDVLKKPETIDSNDKLDVSKYGVIVSAKGRSGLLLPNLDGVDTVEEQVSIALRKAGIKSDDKYSLQRFEVVRYI